MPTLTGRHVAILATDGFEESELLEPRRTLEAAGAIVHIVSLETGTIRGWKDKDWAGSVDVDATVEDMRVEDFDAVLVPGGQINPDLLRVEPKAVTFVRDFFDAGKPVAAICHGPWLLIEAGIVRGRRATSHRSIRTDMKNAGADWVDEPVVVDHGLITSRDPGDLEAFGRKLIEEIAEGFHTRKVA